MKSVMAWLTTIGQVDIKPLSWPGLGKSLLGLVASGQEHTVIKPGTGVPP